MNNKRDESPFRIGSLNRYDFNQADSVWDINAVCPTLVARMQWQIGGQVNILEEEETDDG